MRNKSILTASICGLLLSTALPAQAAMMFNRIASFEVALNNPAAEETSSEIISASYDGMMLIYSDSPAGGIGFVDIADAHKPQPKGFLDMGGEPTSVTIIGAKAYVGVNTSESYAKPSGHLAVVDIATQSVDTTCDVGGQPDSVAKSKDGTMVAVAIENERDEDLNDGAMPQLPAGQVVIFDVANGAIDCAAMKTVDVIGLAEIAPEDPEPEFVDFNAEGQIALTMQENNHMVIIDGASGEVVTHFSAGSVDLEQIDALDNGELKFTDAQPGRLREPDAVKWLDDERFVIANEAGLRGDGLNGSHVMIYELAEGEAQYPQIMSDMNEDGTPIGWVALSGLVADAEKPGMLYAVSDSFLGMQPSIYSIDATQKPAIITKQMLVTWGGAAAQKLDLEGITLDGKGGFWLASEGRTDKVTPHALYNVNAKGEIKKEIGFPDALMGSEIRFGMEGVTSVGTGDDMVLWMAIQREWRDDEKGFVKLVSYTPKTGEWGAVSYPLDKGEKGWVGLSEITAYGDYVYIVERDNQIAEAAKIKKLYRVPMSEMVSAELGSELPIVSKEEVHDFMPDLAKLNGYTVDKVEGFTIDAAGEGFAVTDNDGVDDSSGETYFFSLGQM